MGREIKRIPLDFDWPLNQPWSGYLFPDELMLTPCPDCKNRDGRSDGYTPAARQMVNTFYSHQVGHDECAWGDKLVQADVDNLIKEGRLGTFRDGEWHADPRTAAEINSAPFIHDAINRWVLVKHRCSRLDMEVLCPTCEGNAEIGTPEQKAAAEAWGRTEPPTGEGWQLWETVSEGSPISVVHDTPESLATWMSTDYSWGAQKPGAWTYDEALKWITGPGWAPTFRFTTKATA